MKTLSLSICALSGAIMASAGTIAESFEHARRTNSLDSFGMVLAGIAAVATLIHTFRPA